MVEDAGFGVGVETVLGSLAIELALDDVLGSPVTF